MIDHRNIFLLSFFILFSIGLFGQSSVLGTFDTDVSKNKIILYTTAKDTDLRLTRGDDHFFSNLVQPLETEIAIFVNPKKTFQKFLVFRLQRPIKLKLIQIAPTNIDKLAIHQLPLDYQRLVVR